jgi:tetratricopeptide (TPR) repeat protein
MIRYSLLPLLCGYVPLAANPVPHWFEQANSFYEQQLYDSASAYYEKIIGAGIQNPGVYYNLGNTYFRTGKIGLAILFYEKAHALTPDDPEINANIRYANANIVDKIDLPEQGFVEFLVKRLHGLFSLHAQLWLLLCLLFVLSAAVSGALFIGGIGRLWLIYLSCILLLVVAPLGISVGVKIYQAEKNPYGIVLDKTIDAMNEPSGNKILFTIHEGAKFRISKELQGWSLISLMNGVSGWIPNTVIGRI